jgi:hypothetical protein
MYLNIILTVLVIVLLSMTILATLWWKKYGKKLFDTMLNMDKILPKNNNLFESELGGLFNNLTKFMNQTKSKK